MVRTAVIAAVIAVLGSSVALSSPPATPATTAAPATPEPAPAKRSRYDIPDILQQAAADPYARPVDASCTGLANEISALTAVLGADLDDPEARKKDDDLAAQVVKGAVNGAIPYRSWLRKLSGIEKRERKALAAAAAGGVRRAYLKGLGEAQMCALPAAPLRRPTP